MKVGLFGGTFDPIHLGHFATAMSCREMLGLDEVWFVPAAQSPLKGESTPAEHRCAMIERVIDGVEGLELCDIELRRPPPSYTVDTLRELIDLHPDVEFQLLMSDDVAATFQKWKEPEAILELMPVVVSRRVGLVPGEAFRYLETPIFEVNATEVRERLREGKGCQHFLDHRVLQYILEHNLYS
jgi:nicotinate-nucleotide adenylyltransferase